MERLVFAARSQWTKQLPDMSLCAIPILAENPEGGIKKPTIKRVGSERDRILLEIPVKPNQVLLTFRSTQIIERLRCWVSFNLRTGMCR